jgi:hypothetical protein
MSRSQPLRGPGLSSLKFTSLRRKSLSICKSRLASRSTLLPVFFRAVLPSASEPTFVRRGIAHVSCRTPAGNISREVCSGEQTVRQSFLAALDAELINLCSESVSQFFLGRVKHIHILLSKETKLAETPFWRFSWRPRADRRTRCPG